MHLLASKSNNSVTLKWKVPTIGFTYKQCNYVQFEKKQITKHLKDGHNFKGDKIFIENTQEIVQSGS